MATFSETHAPKHAPAGAEIPKGVRGALLAWLQDRDLDAPPNPKELWRPLCQQIGYTEPDDVLGDAETRFGRDAAQNIADAFLPALQARLALPKNDMRRYAVPGLTTIPAPLFLDTLEIAIELLRERYYRVFDDYGNEGYDTYERAAVSEFNRLFELRGIQYRFDEGGRAKWHGDEGAYEEIVAPALAALADGRLVGSRQEFGDALNALRQSGRQGDKNAIRDASNAVESAMKSVLDDHAVARTGKETADTLWDMLMQNSIVAAKTKDTICSASRLRNTYGGHGPNPQPDPVPDGIPALAVQTAAAALVYLASLLQ